MSSPMSLNTTIPMSSGQQGLWFLCQSDPKVAAAYNVVLAFESGSLLDEERLAAAWTATCLRHSLLAARVESVNHVPSFVLDDDVVTSLSFVDGVLDEIATADSSRPIDTARGPLHRLTYVRGIEGAPCGLVMTLHHLVFDHGSVDPLMNSLAAAWRDATGTDKLAGTRDLGTHTQSVAAESSRLREDASRRSLEARVALSRGAPAFTCPLVAPAEVGVSSVHEAATAARALPPALADAVLRFAADEGTTVPAIHLAAFVLTLWQHGAGDEFTLGVPLSTRDDLTADTVGYHANLSVLRMRRPERATVSDLIAAVSETFFDALTHAWLPFPHLVRALKGTQPPTPGAVPDVGFNYLRSLTSAWTIGEHVLRARPVTQRYAKDLLSLDIDEGADGTHCVLLHDRTRLSAAHAVRLVERHVALLALMVADPAQALDRMPRLVSEDRAAIEAAAQPDAGSVWLAADPVALIEAADDDVKGDKIALVSDGTTLTRTELRARALRVARTLRSCGVDAERRVAIHMHRGIDSVVALLGVLFAGGVHVPLDREQPASRLSAMLEAIEPAILITDADQAERDGLPALGQLACTATLADLEAAPSPVATAKPLPPDRLAYAIHTSGSTGLPKAVGVSAAALGAHVHACVAAYGLGPADRVLQFASHAVDPSLEQLLGALAAGATVVLRGSTTLLPESLVALLCEQRITVADVPTAYWNAWAADDFSALRDLPSLRLLIIGGEGAPAASLPYRPLPFVWINAYGPTETTITAAQWRVEAGEDARATLARGHTGLAAPWLPIGRPTAGTRLAVLDAAGRPVPVGVPGEIHLGGQRLARGYIGQPALTAERFRPDPAGEPGARLYRTGDLGRLREDGQFEFLGRIDHQVKVRGFRVELGEIEAVLAGIAGVRQAVMLQVAGPTPGSQRLVAYVVGSDRDGTALRAALARQLPDPMLPDAWVFLDALPLNSNGKVDRKALSLVTIKQADPHASTQSLVTETERWVAQIWGQILKIEIVSRYDNFFALGGHSLLATQIVARAGRHLDRTIPLRLLLDAPTLSAFAEQLDRLPAQTEGSRSQPALTRRPRI